MKTKAKWLLLFVPSLLLNGFQAFATTLTAVGGLSFGRNSGMNELKKPSPLLGAEYLLDLDECFQIGGFYDHTFLSYTNGTNGTLRYLGALARFNLGTVSGDGPFVDAKVGLGTAEQDDLSSGNKLSFGIGAGYRIHLSSLVSLGPKLGARFLPASATGDVGRHPFFDASVMVSFRL